MQNGIVLCTKNLRILNRSLSCKEGGKSSAVQSGSECYVPSSCVGSVHKAEAPQILCIDKSRGETIEPYTQEDVKKTVKVNVKSNCHGIQRNEFNENNVSVQ